MNRIFFLITSITLLVACKKGNDDVTPVKTDPTLIERKITGTWVASDGGAGGSSNKDLESPKNFQYTFEVLGNNQSVDITLTSPDIDVQYILFNQLGEKIGYSYPKRSYSKSYALNTGKYQLVITADRRAIGNFTLNVKGVKSNPERVIFQKLQSGIQNWGPLGGGGYINYKYNYMKTFKNHFYSFDINEDNATIDIELESPDVDVALVLYNGLGQVVGSVPRNSRYVYKLEATKQGTYTACICTNDRGSIGNYNFKAFGKISNLQRIPSQFITANGSWSKSSKVDIYNLAYESYLIDITSNGTPLDVDIFSNDAFVELYFETSSGIAIDNHIQSFIDRKAYTFISPELPKGTYRIIARSHKNGYGNYTLNVFGKFANFRKE